MKIRLFLFVILMVGLAAPRPPVHAASASLYLSPSSKTVSAGEMFSVGLYVSTDVAINSAEAAISFPTDKLQVTSLSKSGIFTLWAQGPSYSNAGGKITFAGGLPTPGYKGKAGKILTVTFKAKAAGKATVTVSSGSVLADDGQGTNVLRSRGSGTYTVKSPTTPPPPTPTPQPPPEPPSLTPPVITSSLLPDPEKWYAQSTVSASWSSGSGVQGYAVTFNQVADGVAPDVITTTEPKFEQTRVTDGVWYLHVKAKYPIGWSAPVAFTFRVDVTIPEPFAITIVGNPTAEFLAQDATSGLDHYELSLDGGPFTTVTSPYKIPELSVGKHTVVVRAFDKAGNFREASTEFEISGYPQPIIIDLTPVLLGDEPLIIRGLANAQDTLRLTIDDNVVGTYPVAEHNDPSIAPTTEGKTAWRLDVRTNVGAGVHEIQVTAIGPDGKESSETAPVTFRLVTNAIRIGPWIVPTFLILNILLILLAAAIGFIIFFVRRYRRLRRQLTAKPMVK